MTALLWRVWLAEEPASTITRAAAAAHPHETGGVLVGVHTHGSRPWVTHAVELRSPKATSTFYEVPAGARRKAIARLRRRDARLGYLGEWHVHPADAAPSPVDTETIARLAADRDAGCDRPLLLVARRTSTGYVLDVRQLSHRVLRELQIIATGPLEAADAAPARRTSPLPWDSMSADRPQTPRPSGVRMAGDDYQHLYTWLHALHLLRDSEGVTRVEFEVRDAGNVDDLVVHRRDQPTLYHQIKFVIDQRELLTHDWFTAIPQRARKSPLQRFFESFTGLSRAGAPAELALWTNRQLAANDPILKHLDSRSDKLGARFFEASAGSATGKARRDWANHLGVSEEELLPMLEHFRVYPGQGSLEQLRRGCGIYMELVGLRGDVEAVSIGTNEIRRLIIDGCSALENEEMNELVERLGLRVGSPRATLAIQAIDRYPWPELAVASVDWVDEFRGAEPRERRQTSDPAAWNMKFKPELAAAVAEIRQKGFTDIRIDGAFRLSTGFAAGAAAPRAAGLTVAFRDWSSSGESTEFPVAVTEHHVGDGDELAVALCVTGHIERDVLEYIQANSLPVAKLIEVTPGSGVGQTSIPGEGEALGFVFAAFDEIRRSARSAAKLHLFQSAPNGIGILLGHLWNRVPVTQLYDDANSPEGYFPTFLLAS